MGDAPEDEGNILAIVKGWALGFEEKSGDYGHGGHVRHTTNIRNYWISRAQGGSGGYDTKTISVTPGEILTINVGAGGKGDSKGVSRFSNRCWAEAGGDGFVLIQYIDHREDYSSTLTTTTDYSATDKAAPQITELYLSAVRGNNDYYEVKINAKDYGTTYVHYVRGINTKVSNYTIPSNNLTTEVITLIDGYSWKIDTNPNGEPDNKIGDDVNGNKDEPFIPSIKMSTIEQKKYYLHVKPIDKAGNIGKTVHLKLEPTTITLTSNYNQKIDSTGNGPNYVPLSWTKSNKTDTFKYNLYQRDNIEEEWTQVLTDYTNTQVNDSEAEDLAEPEISSVQISEDRQKGTITLEITAVDHGTVYEHYIEAINVTKNGKFYSNTVNTTVKTGIKKFEYTIQNTETEPEVFKNEINATNKSQCTITVPKSEQVRYLYIRAIDQADNIGATVKIDLDGSRTLSKEEKDETKELYCVDKNVEIPALDDGSQRDATVNAGNLREIVTWLFEESQLKLFEIYKADRTATNYPYNTTYSNTLGKYTSTGFKNADDAKAYILSHYIDNTMENSTSQNALYEILAEEGLMTGDTGDNSRKNILYWEAKEYAKFREEIKARGGFVANQAKIEVEMGYNTKSYIVGPFAVDYIRHYNIINDGNGNTKKVDFSGIGIIKNEQISTEKAIRVYDQDGNLLDPNTWELVYANGNTIENRESYSEYPMPYPNEEFWIKVSRSENKNLKGIKKIEIQYYEIQASAQYAELEGNFTTLRWEPGATKVWCDGGLMCPHGFTVRHVVGHTYYLGATPVGPAQDSQPLIEVIGASRGYKNDYIQNLKFITSLDGDESGDGSGDGNGDSGNGDEEDMPLGFWVDLSGNIWNDANETVSDGIKQESEHGIEGIQVFLYEERSNKLMGQTTTDEKGTYEFSKVPVPNGELYYITYTYDGQTYKTTKSFAKGSKEDYVGEKKESDYTDISVLDESEIARQELNDRFNIITPNGAIQNQGQSKPIELEYMENQKESILVTTNPDGTIKDKFKITVSSQENDICFPIKEYMMVAGEEYYSITDNKNINIGLSEREKVDANLRLDVYQTTFTIKGQSQSFLHNGKEIREIYSNTEAPNEYTQIINQNDYNWRLEDYEGKLLKDGENKITKEELEQILRSKQ